MKKGGAPETEEALRAWRQGDVVLEKQPFVFRFNPAQPATPASKDLRGSDVFYAEDDVLGLVIVSQTCDIVSPVGERPYIEVCPLVEVKADHFSQIKRRATPQYAEIPSLGEKYLVADLSRIMTIEKPVLLTWKRLPGCQTDEERVRFAEALARKRARAALPDDFNSHVAPLRDHFKKLYKKASTEAALLGAIAEIRVQPNPNWSAPSISVHFWYLLQPEAGVDRGAAEAQVAKWMTNIPDNEKYKSTQSVADYDGMSAAEYRSSQHLDYDNLS